MSEALATGAATLPPSLPSPERLQELLFDAARLGRDDMVPALLQAGAQIEGEDARGHTPLVIASYNGQESTTALLLSLGALPDGSPDAPGSSALMGVAFKGHAALVKRLLAAGADPNRTNRAGQTALMMAALSDRREVIALLLERGAAPALRDATGASAADVAAAQGNDELSAMLARHEAG